MRTALAIPFLLVIAADILSTVGCVTPAGRHAGYDPATMDPPSIDRSYPPSLEPVAITSHGARLNGIIYVAQGSGPHPTAILLHGYPGNERNLDLAHAMRRAGWTVVFFHYRGSWGSGGTFSIANALDDVQEVVAFLKRPESLRTYRVDPEEFALIGHSMGGYLSLEAAAANPSIRCAASLAGANIGVFGEEAKHDPKIASQLASYIDDAGAIVGVDGKAAVSRWIQHAAEYDLLRLVPKLTGRSVLLVGADRDTIVPSKLHHEPLVRAFIDGHHNDLTVKTFDTDHVFSSHRITLARTVIAWLNSRCKPAMLVH